MTGDLSAHFNRSEFASGDGKANYDTVDAELLMVLETIRDRFGPVTITSGHRSPEHNAAVGGSENSLHLLGRAADFTVREVPSWKIQEFIENTWPDRYGLGKYRTFTHIDTRRHRARWTG